MSVPDAGTSHSAKGPAHIERISIFPTNSGSMLTPATIDLPAAVECNAVLANCNIHDRPALHRRARLLPRDAPRHRSGSRDCCDDDRLALQKSRPRRSDWRVLGHRPYPDDFCVGSGIILFGWVIPSAHRPLDGIFCRADADSFGCFELTGMLQWITNAFSGDGKSASTGHRLILIRTCSRRLHPYSPAPARPGSSSPCAAQTPLGWSIAISGRSVCIKLCGRWLWVLSMGLQGQRRWHFWFLPRFGIRNGRWPICWFLESAQSRG